MLRHHEMELDNCIVINFSGRIDSASVKLFEQALIGLYAQYQKSIILDASDISFISSSGLRVLLLLKQNMAKAHQVILMAGAPSTVEETFRVTGFDSIISVFPDVSSAQQSLS